MLAATVFAGRTSFRSAGQPPSCATPGCVVTMLGTRTSRPLQHSSRLSVQGGPVRKVA